MFTFLGFLVLLAGVGLTVLSKKVKTPPVSTKQGLTVAAAGAGLFAVSLLVGGLFFYADAGMSYLVTYKLPPFSGSQVVHTDPGYHLLLWGDTIAMKQVMTIKCNSDKKDNGDYSGTCEEIEARFNDSVQAKVSIAARFRLPTDPEKMRKLFSDFRSQENLVNSSLVPQVISVVRNSARLLSAQEYMIGKGGEFEQAVLDQMQSGLYILETETVQTHPEDQGINKADRTIERVETVKLVIRKKVDGNNQPLHVVHPFTEYGVTVTQATIEHVDPEEKFKETLGKQRDAAAESSVEQQKAKKAQFQKERIIAEGEAEKSQIQVDQEKLQVQKRIEAETAQRVQTIEANTQKELAQITLDKKQLELKSVEVEASKTRATALAASDAQKAEAAGKRALNEANNSLDAKLNAWVEVNKAYAANFGAKGVVPQIVMGGGSNGGSNATDLINLLTIKTARDLHLDLGGVAADKSNK